MAHDTAPLATSFGSTLRPRGVGLRELPEPALVMDLLAEHGAVLISGYSLTAETFVEFSDQCCATYLTNRGGAFGFAVDRATKGAGGTLMSATGNNQGFFLPLHSEMCYQKHWPDTVWFFCSRPPHTGGQTTFADGREMFRELSARSRELLQSRRLKYVRRVGSKDWPLWFQTPDAQLLEAFCRERDLSLTTLADESIRLDYVTSALTMTKDGVPAFVNMMQLVWRSEHLWRAGAIRSDLKEAPFVVRFEDDTEIPRWLIVDIERVSSRVTFDLAWRSGDAIVVDNRRVMHGRRETSDTDREILVRLGNAPFVTRQVSARAAAEMSS